MYPSGVAREKSGAVAYCCTFGDVEPFRRTNPGGRYFPIGLGKHHIRIVRTIALADGTGEPDFEDAGRIQIGLQNNLEIMVAPDDERSAAAIAWKIGGVAAGLLVVSGCDRDNQSLRAIGPRRHSSVQASR